MEFNRTLNRPRHLNVRSIASIGGILLSVLLFPKLAPIWVLHPLSGLGSLLYFGLFQLIQVLQLLFQILQTLFQLLLGGASKEWLTGAAFAGGYIQKALFELEDEREFTEAELDAFEEFAERVASMSVHADAGMGSDAAVLTKVSASSEQLQQIRTCYRETVMAVPRYDDVYGEQFHENFAAEFGNDLTSVVVGNAQFTRPVQQLLVTQARTSATQRNEHLDVLDVERTSITNADARLEKIDPIVEQTAPRNLLHCSFDELLEYECDLRCASEKCRQVLEDRQHDIHESNQQFRKRSNQTFLQEYLYRSIDPSFPVLAATLERIHTLNSRRGAVVKSISRRY